jgi:hypothetical protein
MTGAILEADAMRRYPHGTSMDKARTFPEAERECEHL